MNEAFLLYSMITAWVAFTVAEMKIGKPLRELPKPLGELFDCPWCFGFWASFAVVALFRPTVNLDPNPVFRFLLDWLLLAWLAGVQSLIPKVMFKLASKDNGQSHEES